MSTSRSRLTRRSALAHLLGGAGLATLGTDPVWRVLAASRGGA